MRLFHARVLEAVAVAAFALAACGSSSKPSSSPATTAAPSTTLAPDTTTAAPTTTALAAATVTVATSAKLGKIIVDSKGKTLYRFENDTAPGASGDTRQREQGCADAAGPDARRLQSHRVGSAL